MEAKWGYKLFGIVAGGVQGEEEGPRFFLFGIDPNNMRDWKFLTTLGTLPRNHVPSSKWSGDFGANWECGTFVHLQAEDGTERTIGVLGVEGGNARAHVEDYRAANPDRPIRDPRFVHWFMTGVTPKGDIDIGTTGLVDWADFYAASIFKHPDGRHILWGWIVDQDLGRKLLEQKGWTGCLGIPREIGLTVYDGVKGTSRTPVKDICSFEAEGERVVTVTTQPLKELAQLRGPALVDKADVSAGLVLQAAPACCEIKAVVDVSKDGFFSLIIREGQGVRTTIRFSPAEEELSVVRSQSSPLDAICLQDEISPLTLLHFAHGVEQLELRVFIDHDVVEVFANGRVAIATRIYAPEAAHGISINKDDATTVSALNIWEMGNIGLEP